MRRANIAIAVISILSGCGSRRQADPGNTARAVTTEAKGQGGATVVDASNGTAIPVPADMPTWAPAFPNAKVVQKIIQADRGTSVESVVLTTSEDMKTVVAFYDAKIAAARMTPIISQDTPDGAVRMVESAPGARDTLMIGQADGSASITLSYSVRH